MSKRDAEADDCGRGVVDVLIKLLGPQPDSSAAVRILRRERWIRIGLLKIFEDNVRFRDNLFAVQKSWNDRARVELDVPGLLMLAGAQNEVTVLPFEAF